MNSKPRSGGLHDRNSIGLLPTVDSASVVKSSSPNANTSAQIAEDLNHIAAFLAANDFDELQLSGAAVRRVLGTPVADILLLLGNSVLHASESAFTAMQKGIAQRLVISGGKGHSTELLYKTLILHPSTERFLSLASRKLSSWRKSPPVSIRSIAV